MNVSTRRQGLNYCRRFAGDGDSETGPGKWTVRNFSEIRTGCHLGRRREILPPMPIPMYRNFTDSDVAAIFRYLQSIPAVKNRVPEPHPPEPALAGAGS